MIATGMVRKLDELGRIVIPSGIRQSFNINPKDELEIFVNQKVRQIILVVPSTKSCNLCGSFANLITIKPETYLCKQCLQEVKMYPEEIKE